MKLTFASLLILSLVLSSSFLESAMADTSLNCNDKCGARCEKAGYKERCMTYCGICCRKCNCVPSGTYGNKSECPCYRDMLNSQGKPKCP